MLGRTWAPRGPRLYYGLPLVLPGAGTVAVGVADRDPVLIAVGLGLLLFGLRAFRTSLLLDAEHALVRNPVRTYRIPYGSILRVDEEPLTLLGTDRHPWVSTTRLAVASTDGGVTVEATGWLPDADRAAIRASLLQLARSRPPAEDEPDRPALYAEVLRLLDDLDPHPELAAGSVTGYADAAEELAEYLCDAPLAADEVAEILEVDDAGDLTRRLNGLR